MAYRDTYDPGQYDKKYTDAPDFNPYDNIQPHQTHDQGGYESNEAGGHREDTEYGGSSFAPGHRKSESATHYGQGAFARATAGNRLQDLGDWRRERHGGLWTKGSRGACIGRFCCCTLMIIVFLIVSILFPFALWIRPSYVIVGEVQSPSNGSEIQLLTDGVQINLEIPISVNNPNAFSVSFSSITADIHYPINNTLIGGGQKNDITFHSNTNTTFTFPFSIEYTTAMSSSTQIFADLVTKCGIGGGTVSDITVDYDLTLVLRVLLFTISRTVSNSASFRCPLTASDIPTLSSLLARV